MSVDQDQLLPVDAQLALMQSRADVRAQQAGASETTNARRTRDRTLWGAVTVVGLKVLVVTHPPLWIPALLFGGAALKSRHDEEVDKGTKGTARAEAAAIGLTRQRLAPSQGVR